MVFRNGFSIWRLPLTACLFNIAKSYLQCQITKALIIGGIFKHSCCKFTTDFVSERIVKIG